MKIQVTSVVEVNLPENQHRLSAALDKVEDARTTLKLAINQADTTRVSLNRLHGAQAVQLLEGEPADLHESQHILLLLDRLEPLLAQAERALDATAPIVRQWEAGA